jgi:hypothetical protein
MKMNLFPAAYAASQRPAPHRSHFVQRHFWQPFCASWILLLLALPAVVQSQPLLLYTNSYGIWGYLSTNGAISLVNYEGTNGTGTNGTVVIPDTIDGLPITCIRPFAFYGCQSLTNLIIGNSVTNIGVGGLDTVAFEYCTSLISVTIGTNVTSIGGAAFESCRALVNITIPDSVTSIGDHAFGACYALTNISIGSGLTNLAYDVIDNRIDGCTELLGCYRLTAINVATNNSAYSSVDGVLFDKSRTTLIQYPIGNTRSSYAVPDSVTNIGALAFCGCTNLTSMVIPSSVSFFGSRALGCCLNLTSLYYLGGKPVYWDGDPYSLQSVGCYRTNLTVYYMPGTTGWFPCDSLLCRPRFELWNPQAQSVGVRSNQFGFAITGTSNLVIVVEVCTNLASPSWTPLQSCALINGSVDFSDPLWTNYPACLYRLRSP